MYMHLLLSIPLQVSQSLHEQLLHIARHINTHKMAEIDTTSIFGDLDRKDPESMRRVMSYIMVRLSGAAHIDASVISDLEPTEIADANRIANEAKDSPFLKEILSIFATARYRSDRRVLQAANGIDLVAIETVRMPNSRPTREYDLAMAFFQSLLEKGEMRYYAEGENEYGDIIDSDDETLVRTPCDIP